MTACQCHPTPIADRVIEAAHLLERMARAATRAPWVQVNHEIYTPITMSRIALADPSRTEVRRLADAALIALQDPAFALRVAALLEREGAEIRGIEREGHRVNTHHFKDTIALADKILPPHTTGNEEQG